MSTVITRYNQRSRTWFFVLGSILMFFMFRFYFDEQYPDWVSYKYIYENQDSNFRLNSYDFVFYLIMDVSIFFKIKYEYFRLLLLILTSWIFIKSLNQFSIKLVVFITLLNLIFLFFQIRQGLAAALFYFIFHIISYKRKVLLSFLALFIHFGSMFLVFFVLQNKKRIKRILLLILISSLFFYSLYYEFIYQYLILNYSQHAVDIFSNQGSNYSNYFLITPILYLTIVHKVTESGILKNIFVSLLLFIIIFRFIFSSLVIPSIVFNSFYRIVVIYLSFMLLKRKLKPNFILFLIVLTIVAKDIISSQL
jgi:hypothetical protein